MSGFILGMAVMWFVVPQLRRLADAHHDLAAELRRLRELAERGRR